MPKLFEDIDGDLHESIEVNNGYANNYNDWRQKEELNKLKTKYGVCTDRLESTDDSDDSSDDDDDPTELTEAFDEDFYKTLACLKKKDPRIYDKNTKFFSEPENSSDNVQANTSTTEGVSKKEKKLTLRDYNREMILQRTELSESEDESDFRKKINETNTLTYAKEQQELKDSIKQLIETENDGNEDDAGLLVAKNKSKAEKRNTKKADKPEVKGKQIQREKSENFPKPLKDFWTDPALDKSEKFLRDYILNKNFLDGNSNGVTDGHDFHENNENLSEDEKDVEQQEEFEHKFNFRFEEPDTSFLKRYPRTIENSLRKKDTKRSQKREQTKKRKEEEKAKKREALKHLKALKRKEIADKIAQLQEITGNEHMQFDAVDLEGDFDPSQHDRKMQELFNDDYYEQMNDNVKPEFPDIDENLGVDSTWDNYNGDTEELQFEEIPEGSHPEDADFHMDADYSATNSLREVITDSLKKKRRRRSKFAEMMSQAKPKFDANIHGSYKRYIDQCYALDYEDMIGDLPCRFKYRNVVPNDYGLSVEEILMADDKELNKWCSLKKALEHKPEDKELQEVKMYKQKSMNTAYKQKVLKSLYTPLTEPDNDNNDNNDNNESSTSSTKKRRKKKNKPEVANAISSTEPVNTEVPIEKGATDVVITKNQKRNIDELKDTADPQNMKKGHRSKKAKIGDLAQIEKKKTIGELDGIEKPIESKTKTLKIKVTEKSKDAMLTVDSKSKQALRKQKYKQLQKKNKLRGSKNSNQSISTQLSEERLKAYGINPKSFRNKLNGRNQKGQS